MSSLVVALPAVVVAVVVIIAAGAELALDADHRGGLVGRVRGGGDGRCAAHGAVGGEAFPDGEGWCRLG